MNFDDLIFYALDNLVKGVNAPKSEMSAYSGMSIAYSMIALAQELKRFNDKEDLLRENMKEDSFEDRWPSMSVRKENES